jgi:SAM-dependent methyltransferase
MRRWFHDYGGSPEDERMIYRRKPALLRALPDSLQRQVLYFESAIEDAIRGFANSMPRDARVLDAGAGEAQYESLFTGLRYTAVDLGVGDADWSYSRLHAVADLEKLPFRGDAFDGCINVVTLEHVKEPAAVVAEMARVLRPGGRLLLVTPLEWEEHQQPHDYFRYTRHGLEYLVTRAGLQVERLDAIGGFFRLLSRRLLNAPQFFPSPAGIVVLAGVALPALLLSALDGLDRKRHFTLGHICIAHKP